MTKSEIRNKYKILRQQLSEEIIDDFSLDISNQLLKLNIWEASFYHVFLPMISKKEVNTAYILNILSGKDKNIVISKSDFHNFSMSHYLLTDTTKIYENSYGIPEPEDGIPINNSLIDVVFVPLVAYNNYGQRIGYGKGFYDRFLGKCKSNTIKIGLSFFEPEVENFKNDSNDVALDFCITPKKIHSF